MPIFNWVFDTLASDDVIDLQFILSDLVDIKLTEAEIWENAYFDSLANATVREQRVESQIPIGKRVY